MKLHASGRSLIKAVVGRLTRKVESKPQISKACERCGSEVQGSVEAVIAGVYICGCGASYKLITACSDVSKLRNLKSDPETIVANCSTRIMLAE